MSEQAATPDLVELTRRILDAADRADFDEILRFYARDAVWDTRGAGSFDGVDAIRRLWEDYYGNYEQIRVLAEELIDFGNGVVLAVNKQEARPLGSSGTVHTREAFLYEWERGLIVRVSNYGDVDEARAAAARLAEAKG
ncbi:MAG TPA: nuclear transport factor 2 family protein [Solirubrobacteraceae bacterium]|nr:nuclear transport factor 2 family protein [Solirubrobacteraceae bacterium]